MGGRRSFVIMVLIAALLSLSFSQGFGRRVKVVRHYGRWHSHHPLHQENSRDGRVVGRQTVETTDYDDPKANTNPKSGALFYPPPPPPPPSPQTLLH